MKSRDGPGFSSSDSSRKKCLLPPPASGSSRWLMLSLCWEFLSIIDCVKKHRENWPRTLLDVSVGCFPEVTVTQLSRMNGEDTKWARYYPGLGGPLEGTKICRREELMHRVLDS